MPKIVPFERQKIAHQAVKDNFFTLYGGSIKGGKTYWMFLELFSLCCQYPGSRWLIVRKTMPTLLRTTMVKFNEILADGLLPYVKDWNGQTMTLTWYNDSQFIFMSENYEDDKEFFRFRGLDINGAGCDELNELQEDCLEKIIERTGSWTGAPGCPPKVIATCNAANNWLKKRVYDPWREGTLKKGWAFVPALIADNPYMPKTYTDSLKENMESLKYAQFVEGDWDIIDVDNPFCYSFKFKDHVGETGAPTKKLPLILAFDFNFDPMTCLVIQHEENEWIKVYREYRLPKSDIADVCAKIKMHYPPEDFYYWVTGDASGKNHTALDKTVNMYVRIKKELGIQNSQFKLPAKNPGIKNNRTLVNFMFEKFKSITFDRKLCSFFIEDVQIVQVKDTGDIDKSNGSITHLLDCWRYFCNTFYAQLLKKN